MKLGVVGLGGFNRSMHAPSLMKYSAEVAPLNLVLCDINPDNLKRWEQQFGMFPSFSDVDEMIAQSRVDAAYVTVPPAACCEVACKFLRGGIPVFTEKPPGMNAGETQRLIDHSRNIPHAVGFNRRFNPVLQKMKKIAEERMASKFIFTGCTFFRTARYDRDFGTTLIHGIDALRFLAGDFTRLTVTSFRATGVKPFHNLCISGSQQRSALTQMTILPVSGLFIEGYFLSGEDITVEARLPSQGLSEAGLIRVYDHGKQEEYTAKELGIEGMPMFIQAGVYAQAKSFLQAMATGSLPGTSFEESLQSVKLVDLIRASMTHDNAQEARSYQL